MVLRIEHADPQGNLDADRLATLAASDESVAGYLHSDERVSAVGASNGRDRCHDESNRAC